MHASRSAAFAATLTKHQRSVTDWYSLQHWSECRPLKAGVAQEGRLRLPMNEVCHVAISAWPVVGNSDGLEHKQCPFVETFLG